MEEIMFSLFNNSYTNDIANFDELQKARKDLIGEIDAIIQYDEHIHNSTDKIAKKIWESIKNEELVHVGELLGLLNYLDKSQSNFVEKGIKEFNENALKT